MWWQTYRWVRNSTISRINSYLMLAQCFYYTFAPVQRFTFIRTLMQIIINENKTTTKMLKYGNACGRGAGGQTNGCFTAWQMYLWIGTKLHPHHRRRIIEQYCHDWAHSRLWPLTRTDWICWCEPLHRGSIGVGPQSGAPLATQFSLVWLILACTHARQVADSLALRSTAPNSSTFGKKRRMSRTFFT